MLAEDLKPNPGKNLEIEVNGEKYVRYPVKTRVVNQGDDLAEIIKEYAGPFLKTGDIVFLSEKMVSISQGRAIPIKDIKPSWLAKFLLKFVHKSPYGIGIGSPWTMELAVREAGAARILLAAFLSAITKPLGIKGVFYKVVGKQINTIDGPAPYVISPYNQYAKLGPIEPQKTAEELGEKISCDVLILDANDLGVEVLGKSNPEITDDFCQKVFKDNPLGQTNEQTPVGILRRSSGSAGF